MIRTWTITAMVGAALLVAAPHAALAKKKAMSCDKILAASEEAGGSKSTDELAKQLGTSPQRVRYCMGKTEGGKDPVPLRKQPAPGEPKPNLK